MDVSWWIVAFLRCDTWSSSHWAHNSITSWTLFSSENENVTHHVIVELRQCRSCQCIYAPAICFITPTTLNHGKIITLKSGHHDNWCTGTLLNRIIKTQWEGMGDVGSVRYEPALLPPFPTISNCQRSTHSISKWIFRKVALSELMVFNRTYISFVNTNRKWIEIDHVDAPRRAQANERW